LLYRLDCRLDGPLCSEDDGRDGIAALLYLFEQIESAHLRHDEIGQHDCGMERLDLREGLLAVRGGFDVKSPAAHELLEADSGSAVVFDNQNAFASCGHA